jgi:phage terminase large subunit-like protein
VAKAPQTYSTDALASAYAFADDVIEGRPIGGWRTPGRLERLCVERFFRDWDTHEDRGLILDLEQVDRVYRFYSLLRHTKGEWAGSQLELSGWQAFNLLNMFGWWWSPDHPDEERAGLRRFRESYEQVARKNGKTTYKAGTALYLVAADREPGAEVYAAATKKDQAKILFNEAARMVRKSPILREKFTSLRNNLSIESSFSKFEPLGADADTLDGLNVHGAAIDELHAHKTRAIYDVIDTAVGARRNPMIHSITTAGVDQESICYEVRDRGEKVLTGAIEDDSLYPYICEPDKDDDWNDELVWGKGNPNLGVSVKMKTLRDAYTKAKASPAAQNAFRRLRLDQWTEQTTRWLDLDEWKACEGRQPVLIKRKAFGGLDLSATRDITAFVLVFPPAGGDQKWQLVPYLFCPEETVEQAMRDRRIPYDAWARDGWIIPTPGNIVDYEFVRHHVNQARVLYDLASVGYDRWNSSQLVTQLMGDGVNMVAMGQGFATMNMPMKEFEKLLLSRRFNVGESPVMRWMFSNVSPKMDPAGNIKPSRETSRGKIDGIVAAIMALGRALGLDEEDTGPSKYESEGLTRIGA